MEPHSTDTEKEHLGALQLEALQVLRDFCGQGAIAFSLMQRTVLHVHLIHRFAYRGKMAILEWHWAWRKTGLAPSL